MEINRYFTTHNKYTKTKHFQLFSFLHYVVYIISQEDNIQDLIILSSFTSFHPPEIYVTLKMRQQQQHHIVKVDV